MSGAVIAAIAILNMPKTSSSSSSGISPPGWFEGERGLSRATPEELAKYMKERDKLDAEIQRKYEKERAKILKGALITPSAAPEASAPLATAEEEDNPTTALLSDVKPKID